MAAEGRGGAGWLVGAEKVKDYLRTAFDGAFYCAFKLILHRLGVCTGGGAVRVMAGGQAGEEPGGEAGRAIPPSSLIRKGR